MTDVENRLRTRLLALESAEWRQVDAKVRSSRRARAALAMVTAVILATLGVSFVVGALAPASNEVQSRMGAFTEGQPLYCTGLDEVSLAEADRRIRAMGLDVTWQIEGGAGDGARLSVIPPASGSIAGGVMTGPKTVVVVIDPSGTKRDAAPAC